MGPKNSPNQPQGYWLYFEHSESPIILDVSSVKNFQSQEKHNEESEACESIGTSKEFQKKIKNTLVKLNPALNEKEIADLLENVPYKEQPPFCASYSEEGVAQELNIKDPLTEADLYEFFLVFYNNLYDKANKKIS